MNTEKTISYNGNYIIRDNIDSNVSLFDLVKYDNVNNIFKKYEFFFNNPENIPDGMFVGDNTIFISGMIIGFTGLFVNTNYYASVASLSEGNFSVNVGKITTNKHSGIWVGYAINTNTLVLSIKKIRLNGIVVYGEIDSNVSIGDLVAKNTDNKWYRVTDFSVYNNMPVGIYINYNTILLKGYDISESLQNYINNIDINISGSCYQDNTTKYKIKAYDNASGMHIGIWIKNTGFITNIFKE